MPHSSTANNNGELRSNTIIQNNITINMNAPTSGYL